MDSEPRPDGDAMPESPTQADDAEIACGLRAGDAHAWDRLYVQNAERVWRAAANYLGGHEADTADVVQQTFLEAARTARNYDATKGPLFAWLWGITRTLTRNRLRHAVRADRHHRGMADRLHAPPHDDAYAALLTAECGELVRGVLLDLPEEYERLLTAKYWHDDTLEAIAARERSTVVAVKSKLARAREAFRRACPQALLPDEVTT